MWDRGSPQIRLSLRERHRNFSRIEIPKINSMNFLFFFPGESSRFPSLFFLRSILLYFIFFFFLPFITKDSRNKTRTRRGQLAISVCRGTNKKLFFTPFRVLRIALRKRFKLFHFLQPIITSVGPWWAEDKESKRNKWFDGEIREKVAPKAENLSAFLFHSFFLSIFNLSQISSSNLTVHWW